MAHAYQGYMEDYSSSHTLGYTVKHSETDGIIGYPVEHNEITDTSDEMMFISYAKQFFESSQHITCQPIQNDTPVMATIAPEPVKNNELSPNLPSQFDERDYFKSYMTQLYQQYLDDEKMTELFNNKKKLFQNLMDIIVTIKRILSNDEIKHIITLGVQFHAHEQNLHASMKNMDDISLNMIKILVDKLDFPTSK